MKSICVFCGSSPGSKPYYTESARELGKLLAHGKITLIYGGAKVGIMGQVAKACLDAGGSVIGVIPKMLFEMELAFTELSQLYIVSSMHERKAKMAELADGFIALPGGIGTLEEFFEIVTWAQLGIHHKPCGLLNTCNYFEKMIQFLDHIVEQQFIEPIHRNMIQIDEKPDSLLQKLSSYSPLQTDKASWVLSLNKGLETSPQDNLLTKD